MADTPSSDPPSPPVDRLASRWGRLVQQADEPLFLLNARRQILHVNSAWEAWAGLSLADVRGQSCRPLRATAAADLKSSRLALMAPSIDVMEGRPGQLRRRSSITSSSWCVVSFFPWMKDGHVLAILGRITVVKEAVPSLAVGPLPEKLVQLRDRDSARFDLSRLESVVPVAQKAVTQARLASQSNVAVLLQGPAGTGKEWLARAIHHHSPRREQFFAVADARLLTTAGIADLLFGNPARLHLGAILLKNPGHLTPELQNRLVEMLDDDAASPRLMVSLDDDPATVTRLTSTFLARVSTLTIQLPSLRDRLADWPRFLPDFLARAAVAAGKPPLSLSTEADQHLRLHAWPGNFRELLTTLRDAALHARAERIELADLPFSLRTESLKPDPTLPLDDLLQTTERRLVTLALRLSQNNKSKAAQILGIWRARLLRRMEQLGIAVSDSAADASGETADA